MPAGSSPSWRESEEVPPRCGSCGAGIPFGANFCPSCGWAAAPSPVNGDGKVPWTLADIGLALVAPGILLALNVLSIAFVGKQEDPLTEAELITAFAISIGFEAALLAIVWNFSVRKYHLTWASLGIRRWVRGGWWFPLAVVAGAFVIVYVWVFLLFLIGANGNGDLPDETFDFTSSIVLIAILSVGFAPIVEELFFRGFLFGGLAGRLGTPVAIALSGVVFALVHAGSLDALLVLPAIGAIGALFAWAYWYTRSLYASIGAHFIFNATQLAIGILAT